MKLAEIFAEKVKEFERNTLETQIQEKKNEIVAKCLKIAEQGGNNIRIFVEMMVPRSWNGGEERCSVVPILILPGILEWLSLEGFEAIELPNNGIAVSW